MDKRELVLIIAKDILCAYKVLPESRIKPDKTIDEIADLFAQTVKHVEKIYNEISE